jgi:hypothetical protein
MAGSWTPLLNQPTFSASTMLLLMDGTVMCHDEGAAGAGTSNWWKLTPGPSGDYLAGTWSSLAPGPNSPLFFASAVLRDGRVFVAGGEYNGTSTTADLLAAELYDPWADSWTTLPTPLGWTKIGDAASCVLPDGRVLVGDIASSRTAIFDPTTNSWTAAASKLNTSSNEETWTLLPDQTLLTADCNGHPQTEKYIIAADRWRVIGSTPTDLVEAASLEIGPAVLLTDGRVFAVGATGATSIYTMPPVASQNGTWIDGPAFPPQGGNQVGAKDAPACLLPNGRVLCVAGPVDGVRNSYLTPTYFFEFDPDMSSLIRVPDPPNNAKAPFQGRMLLLPTGQVMFSNGSLDIELYTPDGVPDPAWKPTITACPPRLKADASFVLHGRQLNGLSQAVSYGDDAQMATNYPIVRLRESNGRVSYCRTTGHSTMGVATGTVTHSTIFSVPIWVNGGPAELSVIANGIASDPVHVTVDPQPALDVTVSPDPAPLMKLVQMTVTASDMFTHVPVSGTGMVHNFLPNGLPLNLPITLGVQFKVTLRIRRMIDDQVYPYVTVTVPGYPDTDFSFGL